MIVVGTSRAMPGVKPGAMIADKYRIEKEIGRGGFGIVVRARHLAIDQVVAIKVLTAGEGGDAAWKEDAARFKREAQATAALRSEHVVRILDVDFLPSGNPYMVMEHLEGHTLHHLIHTRGPLPVAEAVDHILQVLAALGEAHAAGIVHRDLKPANVFVTRGAGGTEVAKVLDFGVSKIGAHSGIGTTSAVSDAITRTGAVIGTVAYMAPEQMVDAKRVDARADLWSVGVILYELVTQQTPFGPPANATLVTSMLTKPPIPLSAIRRDLPPKLEKVVMRCLEKLPERRYATASEVAASLAELSSPRARGALDALRRTGRPTGAAAPAEKGAPRMAGAAEREARKRRLLMAVAAVGALVTIALLGLAVGVLLTTPKVAAPRIGRERDAPTAPARAPSSVPSRSPAPGR